MQSAQLPSSGYEADDEGSNEEDQEDGDGEVTSAYCPAPVGEKTKLFVLFLFGRPV